MIVAHFDQGWQNVKAADLQNDIVKTYLREYFEDSSHTVLINNTWFDLDFCSVTGEYKGEGKLFKNKITDYINEYKHKIDNIIVYCFVDPAYLDPLEGIDVSGIKVRYIGYYNNIDLIDFWAIMSMKNIKDKYVESNSISVPFMCLNGKPHLHREKLVRELIDKNLIDNNFVSFGGNKRIEQIKLDEISPDKEKNKKKLSMDPYDAMSLGDINNWNAHFLNVVTETIFNINDDYFWSEKIFKPIIGKRPFLVYASSPPDVLKKIGLLSYYDDFKDISDLNLRDPDNLTDFLVVLNKQDKSYLQYKYNQLKDKIEINYNLFLDYYSSIIRKIYHSDKSNRKESFVLQQGFKIIELHNRFTTIKKINPKDKYLLLNCEFHKKSQFNDLDNSIMLIGSILPESMKKNIIFYPFHFEYVIMNNKRKKINIEKQQKNFFYEALLGFSKKYRLDLFNRLKENELLSSGLVSLLKYRDTNIGYDSEELAKYDIPSIVKSKKGEHWHSMLNVYSEETKSKVIASQIIPRKIYENSWISLISETFPNLSPDVPDDVFFPTEKTGKALAGGRIFLVSANQGFLKELRNLGFKTFSDYIDESYDELETYQERNEAIVKELKRLQEEVDMYDLHQKLLPVLQHNQDLIYSGKLQNRARLEVVKYIKRYS